MDVGHVLGEMPANSRSLESGQGISALERIQFEAPYFPRCSDNKTAILVRPRKYALTHTYMQINRPGMVSWLIFDLDHRNWLIWEETGLPAPNLIVRNRETDHSHIFYAISPVCTTEKARGRPISFMKSVYQAMAVRLNADTAFHSGPVAKTPGHPWWETNEIHDHEYSLGELAEYLELGVSPWWGRGREIELDDVSHSRHCTLFEVLRRYAYSIVDHERRHGSLSSFSRLLEAFAHNKNNFTAQGFEENLSLSSIRSTVKSVARWTWERYTGASCHRGVMQLDSDLPLAERQSLAAQRTHKVRSRATESKIRGACRQLLDRGERITQIAVAAITGLSRQTVAQYKEVLASIHRGDVVVVPIKPIKTRPIKTGKTKTADVKYAVHQIVGLDMARRPPAHDWESDPVDSS
jgi:hypothetical protein